MNRRAFLATGAASAVVAGLARHGTAVGAAPPDAPKWRAFEVTTRAEIVNPTGGARAWLPFPLMPDTDYHKSQGQSWTGNATTTRIYRERSEEHTSELQSQSNLVCRLLLEKKKK